MDRLWRSMPIPAAASQHSQHGQHGAQTTQQMLDRYYQHVDSTLRLQQATDERIMAVHAMAEGTDLSEQQVDFT